MLYRYLCTSKIEQGDTSVDFLVLFPRCIRYTTDIYLCAWHFLDSVDSKSHNVSLSCIIYRDNVRVNGTHCSIYSYVHGPSVLIKTSIRAMLFTINFTLSLTSAYWGSLKSSRSRHALMYLR